MSSGFDSVGSTEGGSRGLAGEPSLLNNP